jgi:GNAT superfamily N-acetyltransferase
VTLRPATPDDDVAIAACIGAAFPSNPKARLDVLRWQYRDNPFGDTVGWVHEDDGRVVAHYSAFAMPYVLDGERATAGNAVDAAVLPSHQGRGLFTPMAAALYESCAARGFALEVCYATNPIAMRGVARAGVAWQPPLRVLATPRRPGRSPGEEVEGPPAHVDDVWRAMGVRNGVDRGAAWWDWRYARSPMEQYRYFSAPGAAMVVLLRGRLGCVLELVADGPTAARDVVRAAPVGLGLLTVAVEGGALWRLARGAGMLPVPRRAQPRQAYYGIVGTSPTRDWHIGWGDMDHI